jgi:hypothetical protein
MNMPEAVDGQALRAREIAEHFEHLADSGLVLDVTVGQDGEIKLYSVPSA